MYLEVEFWYQCPDQFNGQPIWPISPDIKITTYLEASDWAWGGYYVKVSSLAAKGSFTQEEVEESSTFRDQVGGAYFVLSSLIEEVREKVVCHRTDNLNVVGVLSVGSRKPAFQHEVIRIFQFCLENNVQLHPEWIPREQNELADEISKHLDPDDYMLDPTIFAALDIIYDPHTVDCFSLFRTRQIPRFNSKWRNNPLTVIMT